jgi:glycosyltransferase involved in cell wall biosynthesis
VWDRYSEDAAALVGLFDFSQHDLESSLRLMESNSGPLFIQSISWFLPDFDYAFYGGLHTIFRFAAHLKDHKGIANRFVVLGDASPSRISSLIGQAFPTLQSEPVHALRSTAGLADLPPSDAGIATLWTTAYALLRFNSVRRKFYFIQDFEPMFYPAGSTYAQAEATYRFGFHGIANTRTLKQVYQTEYGGVAEYFDPAVDLRVFYPDPHPKPAEAPYKVFFYGRPGHPRNAFELGAQALRVLKGQLGDQVRILAAGDSWDPAQRGLSGIIENLGRLTYEETARLYRACDVGLVMMFTRHPSYLPFELMASGCLVVSNHNPATRWLLKDGENCLLASPSPSALATAINDALQNRDRRLQITRHALGMVQGTFKDWGAQIDKVHAFMCRPQRSS